MDRKAFKAELESKIKSFRRRRSAAANVSYPIGLSYYERKRLSKEPIPSTSKTGLELPESQSYSEFIFDTSTRQHQFTQINKKSSKCSWCERKINSTSMVWRCDSCHAQVHDYCSRYLSLPCVPATTKWIPPGQRGKIADYAPDVPPMIPSLVIHCINALELRAMEKEGLYRVSGNVERTKVLIEKFLKNEGAPNLNKFETTEISSALKEFLRSLKEPIITFELREAFIGAATLFDEEERDSKISHVISMLPQANRDTLAYLMLHLQRVAKAVECKMPKDNIVKIFSPTLVGFDTQNITPELITIELKNQAAVVESLLNIPAKSWAKFISFKNPNERSYELTRSRSAIQPSIQHSNQTRLSGLFRSISLRQRGAYTLQRSSSSSSTFSRRFT